jgi:cell wall-associated NlpC family hydrolase
MAIATVDSSRIVDLIGKPFEYGAQGPDLFDCYGLVREVYRRSGFELPFSLSPTNHTEIAVLMAGKMNHFRPVEPVPGAIVGMKVGRLMCHVGILVGHDRVLHTWERSGGVVIERLSMGPWQNRVAGYYEFAQ